MDLNLLAPDIQEEILCWVVSESNLKSRNEREVRKIAKYFDWKKQRQIWQSTNFAVSYG